MKVLSRERFVGIALAWLAAGLAVSGCGFDSGSSYPVGSTTAAATASGAGVQWQGPVVASMVPGSDVSDLEPASSEILVACAPDLDVTAVGATGHRRESGAATPVESLASVGQDSFGGCGENGAAGSGDVYQRGAAGWRRILDGNHQHVIVASLGSDLYAFEGESGVTPRVSVLSAGQWTSSTTLLPVDCVPTEAIAGGGLLWVGASPPQPAGEALLFVGDAASGFAQITLPSANLAQGEGERVNALALDAQGELLVALETFDAVSDQALSGRVLRYTSQQTFSSVLNLSSDAPLSLAVQGSTIFAGTATGRLLVGSSGAFSPDVTVPANQGVTRLLAEASTLWVGVRTSQGARVYSRSVVAAGGAGGTLGYADVKAALMACAGCHSTMATGYSLSTGLSNDGADYTATRGLVDLATPDQSLLVTKGSGSVSHAGGGPWAVGSADYDRVLTWIQQGAKRVGTAGSGPGSTPPGSTPPATTTPISPPATPPTTPPAATGGATSYQSHIKPLLSSCVGCHASRSSYRLSSGLRNDQADYQATKTVINMQVPDASLLLTKASNTTSHAGGGPWPTGSAAYQRVVLWIQQGAPFSGGAPAAPLPLPANPTYVTDVKPIMSSCVGCHSRLGDMRLSPNLTNDSRDYRSVRDEVKLSNPARSGVLRNATRQKRGHPVKVFDVGSRPYNVLLRWIQRGARFR